MKRAGPRNSSAVRKRPSLPPPPEAGGAAATGGPAVIPPALTRLLLLVRRRRGRFELLLDPGDVLRALQELLEQTPLPLARRRAECRRLVVGHVEDDRLRRQERRFRRPGDRVRIDPRRHL